MLYWNGVYSQNLRTLESIHLRPSARKRARKKTCEDCEGFGARSIYSNVLWHSYGFNIHFEEPLCLHAIIAIYRHRAMVKFAGLHWWPQLGYIARIRFYFLALHDVFDGGVHFFNCLIVILVSTMFLGGGVNFVNWVVASILSNFWCLWIIFCRGSSDSSVD